MANITPSDVQVDQGGNLLAKIFAQVGLAITTGNVTSDVVHLHGQMEYVLLEVNNAGANALDVFTLQGQVHPDSAFVDLESGADWNTADNVWVEAVDPSTPVTLAGAATVLLALRVRGLYAIRFVISGAGATTVNLRGTMRPR